MSRVGLTSAALLIAVTGTVASAERISAPYNSMQVPGWTGSPDTNAGNPLYAEDFEGFVVGQLPPQGGWTSDFDANAQVSNVAPISGTQSGRHTSDGTFFAGFEANSPIFGPDFFPITADVRRSSNVSLYHVVTVNPDNGFFNTRVALTPDGRIEVAQVNAAMTAFEFIDTGETYSTNEVLNIGVGTTAAGVLNVTLNGSNIFTGLDTSFVLFGTPGPVGQWEVWSDNAGTGSPDGSGDTLTFDNLNFKIPAPSSVALLGLAGLAIRRRR